MSVERLPDVTVARVWRCDGCGAHGHWSEGWTWLGRWEDRAGNGPLIEKVLCPACPVPAGEELIA